MRGGGDQFENVLQNARKTPHGTKFLFVIGQFGLGRKLLVNEKICDFLELAFFGKVEDIESTIMQVIPRLADRTKGRVTRNDT